MTEVQFGRLTDLPLRDAWKHEEQSFTPWLAANIDHLSEAINIPLELTGTEVAVETFSADILARNPQDNSVVLIENQLETTDHTHLGQIMTYLAGLEARTVIWIAPNFREPHLSDIRWLNEHTADGFSFFAVRLRVVRIGDSPFAPIFEVVEKPNDWNRVLTQTANNAQSSAAEARQRFWRLYLERHPEAAKQGIKASGSSNKMLEILPAQLLLGRYVASKTSGVYLRGPNGQSPDAAGTLLTPFRQLIEDRLSAEFVEGGWHAVSKIPHPIGDPDGWPAAVDFLHSQTQAYLALLREVFPETTA